MRRFEYKIIRHKLTVESMDKMGLEGWELVSVNEFPCYSYHFKRERAHDTSN